MSSSGTGQIAMEEELGSFTPFTIGCSSDSYNWSHVYQENECHFYCKHIVSVRNHSNGSAGENPAVKSFTERLEGQLVLSRGEDLIKGVGTGMFQTVTFCSWSMIVWVGAVVVAARRSTGGDVPAKSFSSKYCHATLLFKHHFIQASFNLKYIIKFENVMEM